MDKQESAGLTQYSLDIFCWFSDVKQATSTQGIRKGLIKLSQVIENLNKRQVSHSQHHRPLMQLDSH